MLEAGHNLSGNRTEPAEATVIQFPDRRRNKRVSGPDVGRVLFRALLDECEEATRCLEHVNRRVMRRLAGLAA